MHQSIQQFVENGIPELKKLQEKFFDDPSKLTEFIMGAQKPIFQVYLDLIGESITAVDEILRNNVYRRKQWTIVKKDQASVLCSVGRIRYQKTLFLNKNTGERKYLLDRLLRFEPHTEMTEDAEVRLLEEASESSYEKAGRKTSLSEDVSRQTVMNKVHALQFPAEEPCIGEKKKARFLYIDADEDHVALQYDLAQGDLRKERGCAMPRLVYLYEGIENENGSGRKKLINARYFGGMYDGRTSELWKEVDRYIREHYEDDTLEKIYLHGDGASWIRNGTSYLPKAVFVLDSFHLHKYILTATSHLRDSSNDARSEIYQAIAKRSRKEAMEAFNHILTVTEEETKRKAVCDAKEYLFRNWAGIMAGRKDPENQTGCSAEGHVSHVFSDRMSSRPLGWSRKGVDSMTRLRIYRKNGGDMLKLVRYQKKELPMAAGAEEVKHYYSSAEISESGKSRWGDLGKYWETIQATVSFGTKKTAGIRWHIWNL